MLLETRTKSQQNRLSVASQLLRCRRLFSAERLSNLLSCSPPFRQPSATASTMRRVLNTQPSDATSKKEFENGVHRPALRDVHQQPIPSPKSDAASSNAFVHLRPAYSRSTVTLDIPLNLKKTLRSHALHSVRDLKRDGKLISPMDLQKVIRLPLAECEQVITAAGRQFDETKIRTLHQVLAHEVKDDRFQKIATSCHALDQLLNGGIRIGSLSEIYGAAGCGKTQFCMQLCVNVQMPKSLAGQGGEALFIDCENCFSTHRLSQMAAAAAEQWYDAPVRPEQFRNHIHYKRCTSADMLRTMIQFHTEQFLTEHPGIRLVVLDGIPYQMRYGYESDLKERTKVLHLIAHQMRFLAQSKHVAVVITNQMTYSLTEEKDLPALGQNWAGVCCTKIALTRETDASGNFVRFASLVKSQLTGHWEKIRYTITVKKI